MNRLNLMATLLFCLVLNACVQKNTCVQHDLKLEASTSQDTIYEGESLSVRLSLQGVESDIFKNKKSQVAFFEDHQEGNDFRTFIDIKPELLGENLIGPFKIKLLGKEYQSNILLVEVIKPASENVQIEMPRQGVVGEKIQIKISGLMSRAYSISFIENDIFTINSQSHSTSYLNGNYTNGASFTVILKKKGVFQLNKDLFKDLPDYVQIDPVQFEVN
ncbi:hypothetical protein BZG02_07250 [Labilibaculum filiforme]|uniref:DUF4382 domain-containing protein n=1 Tax=Labilibaculum filiforme TaxID=1940526 RepID=A0A2N3I0Q8_9BACT|nr:hypothetical protein [Labilibaculum filiforme]PKQ63813.1 hypothetical protein BZG02_07250 [Labilibaculum filiforme]